MPKITVLASTLHDPEGRLYDLIKEIAPKVINYFKFNTICLTEGTDKKIELLLKEMNFYVLIEKGNNVSQTYVQALTIAIGKMVSKNEKVLYIDFDRLLHWVKNFQEEFESILDNYENYEFILIGRTERAHSSHHIALLKTEKILNSFFSNIMNSKKNLDIISSTWIITKTNAEKILQVQLFTSTGFYMYWPYALWKETEKKLYLDVEGLEFETPDRFTEEINKSGYDQWLQTIDTGKEWKRRINIVEDTFNEFIKHGQFTYMNIEEKDD